MKKAQNKLKSRRGASITFALLLFLVCAVVGSVVLVAGTAAAGRMSRLAEMDQRYYSVNSAAELIRDAFEGKTVTAEKTTTTRITTPYSADGTPGTPAPGDPTVTVTYKVEPGGEVFSDAANDSVAGLADDSLMTYALYKLTDGSTAAAEQTYTITAEGDSKEAKAVESTVKAVIDPNGTLRLDVYNTDQTKGVYTLRLTFTAERTDEKTEQTTVTDTPQDLAADGTYTIVSTKTETETTSVQWTLQDIQVVTAKEAAAEGGGS